MTEAVKEIVDVEWRLFDQVQNIGGRASCQQDYRTFAVMRSSQLEAWSPALRHSYYCDLTRAANEGRNLLSEKYAHMMARTHPQEYEALRSALPPHDPEKDRLIDSLCAVHVAWQKELAARYPLLAGRGRPIGRENDSPSATSFETYLWGELQTYSRETIALYASYVARLQSEGKSLAAMVLQNTATQYGYASLDEAEAALAAR